MKFLLKAICDACNYEISNLSMLLNLSQEEMDEIDSGKRELNEREVFVLCDKFKISKSFIQSGEPASQIDNRVKNRIDKYLEQEKDLLALEEVKEFFVKNGYGAQVDVLMPIFNSQKLYKGADLIKLVDDYKLFKLIYTNFKMKPGSLIVFYDNGDITSELKSDGPFTGTYNGGHKMVTYGEHMEGREELRIVEDRGLSYESTIEGLFQKNNRHVAKFKTEWNKEHNINEYVNEIISNSVERVIKGNENIDEVLSGSKRKELLEILEKRSVKLNTEQVVQLLLIDYLKRNK